jgi:hypothetical protein
MSENLIFGWMHDGWMGMDADVIVDSFHHWIMISENAEWI